MKKFFKLLLCFIAAAIMAVAFVGCGGKNDNNSNEGLSGSEFASGEGTDISPYVINSDKQWNNIANHPSAHYVLSCDINLGDMQSVAPIGNAETPFSGTINGCGYAIKGAVVSSSHNAGLFGVTSGATIKNLGFSNSTVKMTSDYDENDTIASFVSIARKGTVIENCYSNDVNIIYPASTSKYVYVGGFAGSVESLSEVLYCSSNVKITQSNSYDYARFYIGGFVGKIMGSTVECCSARGSANVGSPISLGNSLRVSAIVDTVSNSHITGVLTEMNFTGGDGVKFYYIAGKVDEETLIYCLNFGTYTCKYVDRYAKCDVYRDTSEMINRYIPAEEYASANALLDSTSWSNNKFWKKGKLYPELISYDDYLKLSNENT